MLQWILEKQIAENRWSYS